MSAAAHLAVPVLASVPEAAQWLRARCTQLQTDSRQLQPGEGFVAWPGAAHDARAFVDGALTQGAAACLVEAAGAEGFDWAMAAGMGPSTDGRVAAYRGLKRDLGPIAAAFYGEPSQALDLVAFTGTNGKTSSAWWLAQALSRTAAASGAPQACGLIGTLGTGRFVDGHAELRATGLTTPDPVLLQRELRTLADAGVAACALEASSIGLAEHRLDGTRLRVAVLTNFTQDHLDYHGSMDAYWAAKRALFDWPGLGAAVVNVDDARGRALAQELQGGPLDLWTVSCAGPARLRATAIRHSDDGLAFDVVEGDATAHPLRTALIGDYNVSNLLGVIAALRALGVPLTQALAACAGLLPVPGRMERIGSAGQPVVAVDYAHTPDALAQALAALRPLAAQRGGRLWCVFGCGGDRDAAKRPLMGEAAEAGADCVVLTSDNPRSEAPQAILTQILCGMQQPGAARVQPDRAAAIAEAIAAAHAADVVLVAGKGHEDYQEAGGVRVPFSDQQHVRQALAQRAAAGVDTEGAAA